MRNGLKQSAKSDLITKGKLLGLNTRSFSEIAKSVFKDIGLSVTDSEFMLFNKSRDSLIHQARFYIDSATTEERADTPPLGSKRDEFLPLLNMTDRVFIKLLGHQGRYVRRRTGHALATDL